MVLLSSATASVAYQQTFNRHQQPQYNQLSSQPIIPQQPQNIQNHQGHNSGHLGHQNQQSQNQQYQQQNTNRQAHSFGATQVTFGTFYSITNYLLIFSTGLPIPKKLCSYHIFSKRALSWWLLPVQLYNWGWAKSISTRLFEEPRQPKWNSVCSRLLLLHITWRQAYYCYLHRWWARIQGWRKPFA